MAKGTNKYFGLIALCPPPARHRAKWVYANVPACRQSVDRLVREQKEAKSATKGNE